MDRAEEARYREKFDAMIMPHMPAAYNLARWLTRNDHDAEDLTQTAFLRAFRFFDGFRGEDARTWIYAIIRNEFYSALRADRYQQAESSFDELEHSLQDSIGAGHASMGDPANIMMSHDRQQQVRNALELLPVHYRDVLILRDMEDLSYEQIASITALPLGTVMSRLSRGRSMLQKHLAKLGVGAA